MILLMNLPPCPPPFSSENTLRLTDRQITSAMYFGSDWLTKGWVNLKIEFYCRCQSYAIAVLFCRFHFNSQCIYPILHFNYLWGSVVLWQLPRQLQYAKCVVKDKPNVFTCGATMWMCYSKSRSPLFLPSKHKYTTYFCIAVSLGCQCPLTIWLQWVCKLGCKRAKHSI